MTDQRLLDMLRRMQAIAQNGLAYTRDPYDRLRYEELQHLVAQGLSVLTNVDEQTWHTLLGAEKGYATPKLDVRGGVFLDDRVLLVRELVATSVVDMRKKYPNN